MSTPKNDFLRIFLKRLYFQFLIVYNESNGGDYMSMGSILKQLRVNNCGADWKEQAVLKAQSYLDVMPFSREGLIDQLEYEGFTHNEAVYGVDHSGY